VAQSVLGDNDRIGWSSDGNRHDSDDWEYVQWLKESPDEDYRWVWQRIWAGGQGKPETKRGALDASDGTMAYWLVTGDEDGDFLKLKEMLGISWKLKNSNPNK
jgi:hypothetical protein